MNVRHRSDRRRAASRLRRGSASVVAALTSALVALAVLSVVTPTPAAAAPDDGVLRVLLFYKSNFHASHVEARQAIRDLAGELADEYAEELEIQETDDPAVFNDENLATVDTLAFAQTGGQLFDDDQREALETYIRGGGGWMGQHYAAWSFNTESEHDVNPFYARLVGATSDGHPENPAVREGEYVVEDLEHPLTQGLEERTTHTDEWYDWNVNPAQNVRTLVQADEATYADDPSGGRQGTTHPITWCQEIDAGRSWYSALGHEGSDYAEPGVRTQMKNGLAYTAGLLPADCSPPAKDEQGSFGGVEPWPLMAINASLTPEGTVQSFGSTSTGCTDPTPYDWTGNGCISQGGQFEYDMWDPTVERTLDNLTEGLRPNTTYTDLFCSMQVLDSHTGSTLTVGGDDTLGANAPNDAALGVTSYNERQGMRNEAPMNYPRWYPTGTTMPNGDIVVQGGSSRGGPGGPGVLTPEIRTADEGSGWRTLEGATSSAAYGDGGADHPGQDENRWWYPRAFVTPGTGTLFNVTGTQMYELDPAGNGGDGELTLRGTLPGGVADQGELGNPVGATSTATMYRPGKILQVGGGWWANGGGPDGARAGLTIDVTGGTEAPVVAATEPMEYQRHWASSTVLPDGDVLVTGGGRENNGRDDTVTNAELWNPDTGQWTTVEVPHEHARLYHSTALLVPDGRVMIAGGGAPGPRNYTDVEYYSPSYLFDGDEPAVRPEITDAPDEIGYAGSFDLTASTDVSRVTLVRNGSVTHGFNNDQSFQDLEFSQSGGTVSVTAPEDGSYAPPGAYMLFVFDADGTPSVASMTTIDPTVEMDVRTPQVVEQFEYPRVPAQWAGANPPNVVDVAPDDGRMTPWTIDSPVQLVRGAAPSNGGLGLVGYHLGLGADGSLERTLGGLDVGREYRISMKYARDSRSAGGGPATAELSVGDLATTLTATTANPSQSGRDVTFDTYVGTFTADQRRETLRLAAPGSGAGMMLDDLVVVGSDPGLADVGVRYEFEEGEGDTVANTGSDPSVGAASLTGGAGWSADGVFGGALELPGGDQANAVDLPDDVLEGESDFSASFWADPDQLTDWSGLLHLGNGTDGFFQVQTQTQADGPTGLAATFKAPGADLEERVNGSGSTDLVVDEWNHVAFTRQGSTGTLYLNGEAIGSRDDLTIGLGDLGPTSDNWLGRNGFPDEAFDGSMDDVRLYDSALSGDDVTALYDDGAAARTTVSVGVDPASPSEFGEPLTVTADVRDDADGPAAGEVRLVVDGTPRGGEVTLEDGEASFGAVTLAPGEHTLEVRFVGAAGFRDSEASLTHTVQRPAPADGVPIRYEFEEGAGTTAANSGTDPSVGPATLGGASSWTTEGRYGGGVSLPGGASGTGNQVNLPDDLTAGITADGNTDFTVSTWVRPDALPNWVSHVQVGSSTDSFFLLQSSTQAGPGGGASGFAATFKQAGNGTQERLTLGAGNDVALGEWTHVVFTMSGTTGSIYFDGELQATRDDFPIDLADIDVNGTTANFVGGTSWPDPRLDASVDDFRMYAYGLSQQEVADLFEGEDGEENQAPVAVGDSYVTGQGETLSVEAPGVLDNDTDADGDDLTATGVTQPADGEVSLEADGSFSYTPDAGFSGQDSFTYTADDGTSTSAPATVVITVEEGEDPPGQSAPVAVADVYMTDQDQELSVEAPGVLANDTDADDDELSAAAVGRPGNGEVTLASDGAFVYTPDPGFSGTDTFVYRANDGTSDSNLTTVTIAVDEVPPAVTAVAGVAAPFAYGRRGSVSVSVSPATATGRVQVLDGEQVIGSGTVADGRGTVQLRATSLRPGTRELTLRYLGDESHAASSTTVEARVTKARATMRVQAPGQIRRGDRPEVRVVMSAPGPVAVDGRVRVTMQGRRAITRWMRDGRLAVSLPRATRVGPVRVRVVYTGSGLVERVSEDVTIRVRR